MANMLDKLVGDDFVWTALTSALTGNHRRASTGFINMNCPMCQHRGHRPDTRRRCGLKNNNPGVGLHCFNCGFDTRWSPGDLLPANLRDFMENIGVPSSTIKRVKHRAFSYRRLVEANPVAQALIPTSFAIDFPERPLPAGAETITALAAAGCSDPDFLDAAAYLLNRGDCIAAASEFYWTPDSDRYNLRRRIIIPFYQGGRIVGWTGRLIDSPRQFGDTMEAKYHSSVPSDYVFNNHVMLDRERKYVIVCEGPFDALAIDGIAVLGAKMSDRQAAWIDGMGKTVIVLPDHDRTGERLIDAALARNWHVALPLIGAGSAFNWWDPDVKDAADAVARYGRLYTVTSILKSATQSRIEVTVKRKMMNN